MSLPEEQTPEKPPEQSRRRVMRRRVRVRKRWLTPVQAAQAIFALLITAAPLAVGAVDQVAQICLVALFAIGLWLVPPMHSRLSRATRVTLIAIVAVLVLKDLGPASWFGSVSWRPALAGLGVSLPRTHHPEFGRAIDAALTGAVAVLWFLWVRTLALDRDRRAFMVWSMFVAAAVVATMSFVTARPGSEMIYGWRQTPGWTGFGPFPSRHHTACFFGMGLILGAGCVGWAGVRLKYPLVSIGLALEAVVLFALFRAQSRVGLVATAVGLALLLVLTVLKFRSARAVGLAAGTAAMALGLALAFGGPAVSPRPPGEAEVRAREERAQVRRDSIAMWKEAPLFGHGVDAFAGLFPLYQSESIRGRTVLDSRSSWLQWLVELGLIPVVLGAFSLAWFVVPELRVVFSEHRSVFLRAAAAAAVATLLFQSGFDVPAHRWATAGFALAALAIGCAPSDDPKHWIELHRAAFIPMAIVGYWMLPLIFYSPSWAPLTRTRLLADEHWGNRVDLAKFEAVTNYFPLDASLHLALGLRKLENPAGAEADWQQHFEVAARLSPASLDLALQQARATTKASPASSLRYWKKAVASAGPEADEILAVALMETSAIPEAAQFWRDYTRDRPELLLTCALLSPGDAGKAPYLDWWQTRGLSADNLSAAEVSMFYRLVARWGDVAQLSEWCRKRSDHEASDYKTIATLFYTWTAYDEAWAVLSKALPDPAFPPVPPRMESAQMEALWSIDPRNTQNARELAGYLAATGDLVRMREIVLTVARKPRAPEWFVRKGAHLLAADGEVREAVELCLGIDAGETKPPP